MENKTLTDLVSAKKKLRRAIREQREQLDGAARYGMDQVIRKNLLSLCRTFCGGLDVYCYVSFGGEADTRGLLEELWRLQIPVASPRVEGDAMAFYRVFGMDDLEPGYRRIPEPKPGCAPANARRAAVIVPGTAFTEEGARLGYGGGFYDRYLASKPDYIKIAAAYEFQIQREIPAEPHDVKMDWIVTERRILCIGSGCPE